MPKLIAYFEGQCSELRRLIKESEEAREQAPQWLIDAQILAAEINAKNDANF